MPLKPDFLRRQLPEIKDWNFSLLAGSPGPDLSSQLRTEHIPDIMKALKESYNYVLVDIGSSLSRITLPLIQHADQTVLLVNTDASAISLTKILWDYLARKGIGPESVYLILNHAVSLEGLNKAEAEQLLGISINSEIPHLGANFAFANNHHEPFTIKFPNDTAALIFQEAVKEITALARTMRVY